MRLNLPGQNFLPNLAFGRAGSPLMRQLGNMLNQRVDGGRSETNRLNQARPAAIFNRNNQPTLTAGYSPAIVSVARPTIAAEQGANGLNRYGQQLREMLDSLRSETRIRDFDMDTQDRDFITREERWVLEDTEQIFTAITRGIGKSYDYADFLDLDAVRQTATELARMLNTSHTMSDATRAERAIAREAARNIAQQLASDMNLAHVADEFLLQVETSLTRDERVDSGRYQIRNESGSWMTPIAPAPGWGGAPYFHTSSAFIKHSANEAERALMDELNAIFSERHLYIERDFLLDPELRREFIRLEYQFNRDLEARYIEADNGGALRSWVGGRDQSGGSADVAEQTQAAHEAFSVVNFDFGDNRVFAMQMLAFLEHSGFNSTRDWFHQMAGSFLNMR